jgi:hypothetical protein
MSPEARIVAQILLDRQVRLHSSTDGGSHGAPAARVARHAGAGASLGTIAVCAVYEAVAAESNDFRRDVVAGMAG